MIKITISEQPQNSYCSTSIFMQSNHQELKSQKRLPICRGVSPKAIFKWILLYDKMLCNKLTSTVSSQQSHIAEVIEARVVEELQREFVSTVLQNGVLYKEWGVRWWRQMTTTMTSEDDYGDVRRRGWWRQKMTMVMTLMIVEKSN